MWSLFATFQARLDDAQDLVDAALAIAADRRIERQSCAPRAAEELVNRLIEELAFQVPQCNVHCRQCAGQCPLPSKLGEFMQQRVVQHFMIERIRTDQLRREIVPYDPERGQPAMHRRRLTDTDQAVVTMDSDPSAALRRLVLRRPSYLEDLDITYLHRVPPIDSDHNVLVLDAHSFGYGRVKPGQTNGGLATYHANAQPSRRGSEPASQRRDG
jgi:hypothetical protein